jgi:hypothetical protein
LGEEEGGGLEGGRGGGGEISKLSGNYRCEKDVYPALVPRFSISVMWRSHQYVVQSVVVHIHDAYCSAEILAYLLSFQFLYNLYVMFIVFRGCLVEIEDVNLRQ